MYTSPERVTRNGYLVAYAGEIMTEAEAERRGLLKAEAPKRRRRKARDDEG